MKKLIQIIKGIDQKVLPLDLDCSLVQVRKELTEKGIMRDSVLFCYDGSAKIDKTDEHDFKLSVVLKGRNKLILTDTESKRPDLLGDHVDWLRDRHLAVQVRLNMVG